MKNFLLRPKLLKRYSFLSPSSIVKETQTPESVREKNERLAILAQVERKIIEPTEEREPAESIEQTWEETTEKKDVLDDPPKTHH